MDPGYFSLCALCAFFHSRPDLFEVLLLHPEEETILGDSRRVDNDVGSSCVFVEDLLEAVVHL